jgi:hypothetical protein
MKIPLEFARNLDCRGNVPILRALVSAATSTLVLYWNRDWRDRLKLRLITDVMPRPTFQGKHTAAPMAIATKKERAAHGYCKA